MFPFTILLHYYSLLLQSAKRHCDKTTVHKVLHKFQDTKLINNASMGTQAKKCNILLHI